MRWQIAFIDRVVPAQFSVLPAQIQVQSIAVAPVPISVGLVNGNRLVFSVDQAVAGQPRPVVTPAGGVKPPVFRHTVGGVAVAFVSDVVAGGMDGCYFQHEIRRLFPFRDGIAPRGHYGIPVHAESDDYIRVQQPLLRAGNPADGHFAQHQSSIRRAQMPNQRRDMAGAV